MSDQRVSECPENTESIAQMPLTVEVSHSCRYDSVERCRGYDSIEMSGCAILEASSLWSEILQMTRSRVLTMTKAGHGQTRVFKQVCGRALTVVAETGKLAVGERHLYQKRLSLSSKSGCHWQGGPPLPRAETSGRRRAWPRGSRRGGGELLAVLGRFSYSFLMFPPSCGSEQPRTPVGPTHR